MRHQRLKDIYFLGISPIARVNHVRWARRFRVQNDSVARPLRLNLGSGHKYLPGLTNIEASPSYKKDMWLDLRNGLPFPDGSVEGIYSCHVLEHFFLDELQSLLAECNRVLREVGVMRIVVPSAEKAIAAYQDGDMEWFADWPASFSSIGGRLYNYLFCAGQHRMLFDLSFIDELLRDAGFGSVTERAPRESSTFSLEELQRWEPEGEAFFDQSLIVEAGRG